MDSFNLSYDLSVIIFGFVILLVLYQIGLRLTFVRKLMCERGYHKHSHRGKKKFRCVHCKKPKTHLSPIEGGRKF